MRTVLRGSIVTALLLALLAPVADAAAAPTCADQWVETYEVRLESARKVYRLGDTAPITAIVTDRVTGMPVADAEVAAGAIDAASFYSNDVSRSDVSGKANLQLHLPRGMEPGWVELRALARTYYDQAGQVCGGLWLYGFARLRHGFRLRR